jgi:hypothetical protein
VIGQQIVVKVDADTSRVTRWFNLTSWVAAVRILGCAYEGQAADPGALTAELRWNREDRPSSVHIALSYRLFDRTGNDLLGEMISEPSGWRRVPDHWALPWVTEYLRRLEIEEDT